jgi:hypothetical protein
MEHRFGTFIILGLVTGCTMGVYFGTALENPLLSVGLGGLGGLFLSWFIAAAIMENQNIKFNK